MSKPPVAARRPFEVTSPHGTRQDPYYWLRDDERKNPDVLAYLEAENAYTEAVLAPQKSLEEQLFTELRARVKEDDTSVPVFDHGYWYYVRYEHGKQYPIIARKQEGREEVLLDGNTLAQGHAFYKIGGYSVSPDSKVVAWAEDTVGRNQFVLRVKVIATGEVLPITASNISGALAWAADSKTLFYGGRDPVTLRADRVTRVVVTAGSHELVHREEDASFYVSCGDTKSRRFITISMRSTTQSEYLLIDAASPQDAPRAFLAREKDHLYGVDHLGDRFVLRTNDHACH